MGSLIHELSSSMAVLANFCIKRQSMDSELQEQVSLHFSDGMDFSHLLCSQMMNLKHDP